VLGADSAPPDLDSGDPGHRVRFIVRELKFPAMNDVLWEVRTTRAFRTTTGPPACYRQIAWGEAAIRLLKDDYALLKDVEAGPAITCRNLGDAERIAYQCASSYEEIKKATEAALDALGERAIWLSLALLVLLAWGLSSAAIGLLTQEPQ